MPFCSKRDAKVGKDTKFCQNFGKRFAIGGRMFKSVFEKPSRRNLLFVLFDIVLVICVVLVSLHIIGLMPESSTVEGILAKNLMLDLLYLGIFLLALGLLAGYEIGRYIEMKLGERRAIRAPDFEKPT
jgi:hypothetical protein